MKLTLIKPNIGRMEHSLYVDEGRMEPLQLGIIAALTPMDVEVVLYDDRIETISYNEPTDLVAITVETYTARRAYEISAEYRRRGVPVIMGGTDRAAQHVPALIYGKVDQFLDRLLPSGNQRIVNPQACAGLQQDVAAPLAQGQIEVSIITHLGFRGIGGLQV